MKPAKAIRREMDILFLIAVVLILSKNNVNSTIFPAMMLILSRLRPGFPGWPEADMGMDDLLIQD